jgi:hypothetical protein
MATGSSSKTPKNFVIDVTCLCNEDISLQKTIESKRNLAIEKEPCSTETNCWCKYLRRYLYTFVFLNTCRW